MNAKWQNVMSVVALLAALAINAWPTTAPQGRTQVAKVEVPAK